MPELPEVEVTKRSIAARLHGAHVLAVRCGKPLRWPLGCAPESLVGARVGAVARRGKYLWLPLLRDDPGPSAGRDGGLLLLQVPRLNPLTPTRMQQMLKNANANAKKSAARSM